jgi:hypothetical protein
MAFGNLALNSPGGGDSPSSFSGPQLRGLRQYGSQHLSKTLHSQITELQPGRLCLLAAAISRPSAAAPRHQHLAATLLLQLHSRWQPWSTGQRQHLLTDSSTLVVPSQQHSALTAKEAAAFKLSSTAELQVTTYPGSAHIAAVHVVQLYTVVFCMIGGTGVPTCCCQ